MGRGYHAQVKPLGAGRATHQARSMVVDVLDRAGVGHDAAYEAEVVVSELVCNAVRHSREPYEMRIISAHGHPYWCEIFDGDQALQNLPHTLEKLSTKGFSSTLDGVSGRGLEIVYRLTAGRCEFYPGHCYVAPRPGKVVAFALPTRYSTSLASVQQSPSTPGPILEERFGSVLVGDVA
ncbi:ATP-binding protein [Nonomuraea sp. KM90]|uniref:ATP-binding protein n=1 Tax=Nonomuraea sp. KM90 TaxID=3457428 RepID=UPI003FCDA743